MLKQRKNKKRIVLLALTATVFFSIIFNTAVFRNVENITYDWRLQYLQDKEPTGNIVLVFIGDDTLELLGQWPLPREWYAGLTDILNDMGARAIVFDILFIDKAGEADEQFARSIKDSGNVILPFFFVRPESAGGVLYSDKIYQPIEEFKSGILSGGFINVIPDSDGVIRKYPLFIRHREKTFSSICLSVIEDVMKASMTEMARYHIEFEVENRKTVVPLAENQSAYLNVYPDLNKFPNYSFVQVFQSYKELAGGGSPIVPANAFADKIVLIGYTATGASDTAPVPGVANYPLMGVHASFLENFLKGEFIKRAGIFPNFIAPLFFSLTAGIAAVSFPPLAGILFVLLLLVFFVFLAFSLFTSRLFCIDILPAVMSVVFVYAILILREFVSERKEKIKTRTLFGRYISPAVMEKLLDLKEGVVLEGEEKFLTVLFADIRGFTSFADKHSPEETFSFLNSVLSIMSDAVFKFGGTLDKFIGDEVMAVYGAPVEDPEHAVNAVLSAKEMMQRMKEFNGDVKIGIGINTGNMIIGNVGTPKRMEYTTIGDAVNVAARIEELTAGGEILIGQDTYEMIEKEGIPCEKAGAFRVKGKSEAFVLYRVLWEKREAD